jgi:hypothetical protein
MPGVPARAPIGVVPAAELARRPRLFGALEAAYPIRFEGRADGEWRGLAGVVAIGSNEAPADVPSLLAVGEELAPGQSREVALANDELLERPLRSARLTDTTVPQLEPDRVAGRVLATVAGAPAWCAGGADAEREGAPAANPDAAAARADLISAFPAELSPDEALRDRLYPGRCLALLALAHFLARCSGPLRWRPAPLHAAFVIDDPNLRWPSYGHIRYDSLDRHASEHGYHLAVAMVPLDAWFVHPAVAHRFRASAGRLSVCVHGNDHAGPELGRPSTDAEGTALAAQALRRFASFERRSGIPVSRVMVPPHERLSEAAARGLYACDYDAVCATRPYPWMPVSDEQGWLARPTGAGALTGWRSADVVAGGLPLILRSAFSHPREDLVLRAFLGQPLILYGHHQDLQTGLDPLAQGAADISRLGEVRWGSLRDLARTRVETRRSGATLEVRPFAGRVRVEVPDGVKQLRVDTSMLGPADDDAAAEREPIPVSSPGTHELTLSHGRDRLDLESVPAPPARLWPLARRMAGEGRDRLAGVLAR